MSTLPARVRGAVGRWGRHVAAAVSGRDFVPWLEAVLGVRESDVTSPMAQCTWVFAAIRVVTATCSGLPWKVVRAGQSEALTSGAALELLKKPGPGMTFSDLVEQIVGHLWEGGEAHVLLQRGAASGMVRGLLPIGRRQMREECSADDGSLLWWEFTPTAGATRRILPGEDAHLRLFNPYHPIRGLSPLQAASLGVNQDFAAATYNREALRNGAQPGGFYSTPNDLSEEQRAEFRSMIKERHGGPSKANTAGLLWGGMTYQEAAWKNTDLALYEGRRFNREEIFAALGVPPVLGNVFDAAHYNIADAAQEIFLNNTIAPAVRRVSDLINTLILPLVEPGVELVIDVAAHHVMQRVERSKLDALGKGIDSGVPYNEAVAFLGLPFRAQDWGDTSLVRSGLAGAAEVAAGLGVLADAETGGDAGSTDEQPVGDTDSERSETSLYPAAREEASLASLRREEERQVAAAMPAWRRRMTAWFRSYRRRLLKRLEREFAQREAAVGTSREAELRTTAVGTSREVELRTTGPMSTPQRADAALEQVKRIVLNIKADQVALARLVRQEWPRSFGEALRAQLEKLIQDDDENKRQAVIEGILRRALKGRELSGIVRHKVAQITTVEGAVRRRVEQTLLAGVRRNESLQELTTRVHDVVGEEQTRGWAARIARNESGQAVAMARYTASGAAGMKRKGWLTGRNPRETHVAAGGAYNPLTNSIDWDEDFVVGDARLAFPRDPRGPAGEIINCNCILVPRVDAPRAAGGTAVLPRLNRQGAAA